MSARQPKQKRNRGDDPAASNKIVKINSTVRARDCREVMIALQEGRLSIVVKKYGGFLLDTNMPPGVTADSISFDAISMILRVEEGNDKINPRITLQDWFKHMPFATITNICTQMPKNISWGDEDGSQKLPIGFEAIVCLSSSCTAFWSDKTTFNGSFAPSPDDVSWMVHVWQNMLTARADNALFARLSQTCTWGKFIRLVGNMNEFIHDDEVNALKLQAMMAEDMSMHPIVKETLDKLVDMKKKMDVIMGYALEGKTSLQIKQLTGISDPQAHMRKSPRYALYNELMAKTHQGEATETPSDAAQVPLMLPSTFSAWLMEIQNADMKKVFINWSEQYFKIDKSSLTSDQVAEWYSSVSEAQTAMFYVVNYSIVARFHEESQMTHEDLLTKFMEKTKGKSLQEYGQLNDGVDFMTIFRENRQRVQTRAIQEMREYVATSIVTTESPVKDGQGKLQKHCFSIEYLLRRMLQKCWSEDFDSFLKKSHAQVCIRNYGRRWADVLDFETPVTMDTIREEFLEEGRDTMSPDQFDAFVTAPILSLLTKWKWILRANWNSYPRALATLDFTKEEDRKTYEKIPLALAGALNEKFTHTSAAHGDLAHDLMFFLLSCIQHPQVQKPADYDICLRRMTTMSILVKDLDGMVPATNQMLPPPRAEKVMIVPDEDDEAAYVLNENRAEYKLMEASTAKIAQMHRVLTALDARDAEAMEEVIQVSDTPRETATSSNTRRKPRAPAAPKRTHAEEMAEFQNENLNKLITWMNGQVSPDDEISPEYSHEKMQSVKDFFTEWAEERGQPVRWMLTKKKPKTDEVDPDTWAINRIRSVLRAMANDGITGNIKNVVKVMDTRMRSAKDTESKYKLLADASIVLAEATYTGNLDALANAAARSASDDGRNQGDNNGGTGDTEEESEDGGSNGSDDGDE